MWTDLMSRYHKIYFTTTDDGNKRGGQLMREGMDDTRQAELSES